MATALLEENLGPEKRIENEETIYGSLAVTYLGAPFTCEVRIDKDELTTGTCSGGRYGGYSSTYDECDIRS